MGRFDFINDEEFRNSLESDTSEVQRCIDGNAWKAVHVLVGSMIECLLMDHLLATGFKGVTRADLLKKDLSELIEICRNEKVLTSKTIDLSSAVKTYRNLIHPGRLLRLGEKVDGSSAAVAQALLQMVISEITARKKEKCGLTAEQIIAKLECDPSGMTILHHLLKDTTEPERQRLLLKVLPARYFDLDADFVPNDEVMERLSGCFRATFDIATDETKKKVTMEFVSILKQEGQNKVYIWETEFFRASDMKYLDPIEIDVVRDHMLSRLGTDLSISLLNAMRGIGKYLRVSDIEKTVDPLIRVIVSEKREEALKAAAEECIPDAWLYAPQEVSARIMARLDAWITNFCSKGLEGKAEKVRKLKKACEAELPF